MKHALARFGLFVPRVAALTLLAGCGAEPPLVAPEAAGPVYAQASGGAGEPEVFGNVYENGQRSTRTNLTVTIEPLDPETQSRLRGQIAATMWATPHTQGDSSHPKGWAYGWFDPRAGNNCGTIEQYNAGNNAGRLPEAHWANATTPPDTTQPEGHCIRPGRYQFTLSGPGVSRTFAFEYAGARAVTGNEYALVNDPDVGGDRIVEPHEYRDADVWTDYVIHIDLSTSSAAPTPVLRIQNSHQDPYAPTFTTESSPVANETDWLRFSSLTSTGIAWNLNDQGRVLARYH